MLQGWNSTTFSGGRNRGLLFRWWLLRRSIPPIWPVRYARRALNGAGSRPCRRTRSTRACLHPASMRPKVWPFFWQSLRSPRAAIGAGFYIDALRAGRKDGGLPSRCKRLVGTLDQASCRDDTVDCPGDNPLYCNIDVHLRLAHDWDTGTRARTFLDDEAAISFGTLDADRRA